MLTGTRHNVKEMEEKFEELGAETVAISLIETRYIQNEKSEVLLRNIQKYNWITFVSVSGVNAFFESLARLKIDRRKLGHIKFAVVGKSTTKQLWEYGYEYDFVPTQYSSEVMAKEWIPLLKADEMSIENRVLVVRGVTGMSTLENELANAGIYYDTVYLYETIYDQRRKDDINRIFNDIDCTIIASGLAGRALSDMLEVNAYTYTGNKIVAIGEETKKVCTDVGVVVDLIAKEHTVDGIVDIICQDVKK